MAYFLTSGIRKVCAKMHGKFKLLKRLTLAKTATFTHTLISVSKSPVYASCQAVLRLRLPYYNTLFSTTRDHFPQTNCIFSSWYVSKTFR